MSEKKEIPIVKIRINLDFTVEQCLQYLRKPNGKTAKQMRDLILTALKYGLKKVEQKYKDVLDGKVIEGSVKKQAKIDKG